MRKRSVFVWLAASLLLVATTAVEAQRLNVGEVVKQTISIPKIGKQLAKIVGNGAAKISISAACIATACVINFAAPTAAEAADTGINFSHSIGTGVYHEGGDNIGTFRIGTRAEAGNLNAYATTALRTKYGMVRDIDEVGIKARSYLGANMLLFDYGENNINYGYLNTDIFVGGTRMHFRNARAYLLRWSNGVVKIAGLGYEYVDNDLKALNNPSESGDPVRSHGVALYRAGVNYPITDLFTTSNALAVNLKLNSAMHLGGVGPVKLGETWQGELNGWAGDDADLDHLLYHTAGGSIDVHLADDRIKLTFGGAIQHTIDGDIKRPGQADGNFDIRNTLVSIEGNVGLTDDVSLNVWFHRYDQSTQANLEGKRYDNDASGTRGRLAVIKKF